MDPQFDNYRKMLELATANRSKSALREAFTKTGLQIHETEPWSGYYRLAQTKDGPLEPLGIWREAGVLFVVWGSIVWQGEEARIERFWPHAVWNPVPYDWFEAKLNGKEWPDVHQLAAGDEPPLDAIEEIVGRAPDSPPAAGHNSGATVDELRLLADEIDEAKRGVKQYATITSDEQRDQSQDLRSKLLKFSGRAKKTREALLEPHRRATAEINEKWKPLEDGAKESADKIRTAQEAWGTEKLRRQRAEQARLDEEKRQREAALAEQAAAAEAAIERGEAPPEPVFQAAPVELPRVAPQTSFKGGAGRAAHEKAVEVITEVTDWKALFLYFVEDQAVRDFVLKRAQSILKATGEVAPGVKTDVAAKVA
jgi:hypothetical protein